MNNDKQNLIAEHALLNTDNLLLSLEIFNAFEEVMNRLISDFLKELENELILNLGNEWIIINEFNNNALKKWYFGIQKKTWQDAYMIGFNPQNEKLRNISLYTWRDSGIFKNPVSMVNKMLNQYYIKGKKYEFNDWVQVVDSNYLNWTDADTLTKLYHKREMVNYFKEHMLRIKDIVEPIIDKELRK